MSTSAARSARLAPRPFWYLRHGQTDANAAGLAQGRIDVPLNATGRAQARRAGKALAALFAGAQSSRDHPFAHIVSSPLSRAHETARIAQEEIRAAGGPELEIRLDTALVEVSFGVAEGEDLADWYDKWILGGPAPQDGETFAQLADRAVKAVNDVTAVGESKGLPLIVAHGALFRSLRGAMGLDVTTKVNNAEPFKAVPPKTPNGVWTLEFPKL